MKRSSSSYIPQMQYTGELAGLAAALLWAITSIFFAEASKLIGSFYVNKIRLLLAVCIYTGMMLLLEGRLFPASLNSQQVMWLGLSGFIGLVFGDSCGFKALVMIGPRLTTLLYSTAPIFATIIAWLFLGERLNYLDITGIVIAISGISWVVAERRFSGNNNNKVAKGHPDEGTLFKGVMLGLGAALGQAVGLVLAKKGMVYSGDPISPIAASYIRMIIALVSIWLLSAFRGQTISTIKTMKNLRAMSFSFGGTVFGPFLGVWMSLVAVKYIATGIAATLNSMTPVMILPLLILYYKEKISLRALLGAVLAVAGVAMIFLG